MAGKSHPAINDHGRIRIAPSDPEGDVDRDGDRGDGRETPFGHTDALESQSAFTADSDNLVYLDNRGTTDATTGARAETSLDEWVILLETAEASTSDYDFEKATTVLPQPLVPAPDPKVLAIPPERVRQLVRRPVPRGQRPSLQMIEILPTSTPHVLEEQETSVDSEHNEKEGEAASDQPARAIDIADDGRGVIDERREEGRAMSGAIDGKPYRWVVSRCIGSRAGCGFSRRGK